MLLKSRLASMIVLIIGVGSFAFPSIVLSQNKNKQSTTFIIEDERYQLTLPIGFCIPTGERKKEADSQAQLDSSNITDVTAIRCSEVSGTEGLSEWIILKTPKGSLGKRIPTRESLIRDFKKGLSGSLQKLLNDAGTDAKERMSQIFSADELRLGKLDMTPIDVDDNAGYIAGTMDVSIEGTPTVVAGVFAMTRVKKHIFAYYRYTKVEDKSDLINLIARMLQLTKNEVRGFIEDNRE